MEETKKKGSAAECKAGRKAKCWTDVCGLPRLVVLAWITDLCSHFGHSLWWSRSGFSSD